MIYRIIMANNKRKGRTRIKLDARKIALAKQLILREATTTVIANELNISRTFAWRLRKSLVNGISLHERVIDPPEDEEEAIEGNDPQGDSQMPDHGESLNLENHNEHRLKHQPIIEHIKRERATTEEEEEEEEEERMQVSHNRVNNHESENESEDHQQNHQHLHQHQLQHNHNQQHLEDDQSHYIPQQPHLIHKDSLSVATSVIQRTNELKLHNAQHQQQQFLTTPTATATATSTSISTSTTNAILEQHKIHNKISVVQQQRLMEINNKNAHLENNDNHDTASDTDTDTDNEENHTNHPYLRQQQQILEQQQRQMKHQETEIVNSHAQQQLHQQQQQRHQHQHHQQSFYLQQKSSTPTTLKAPEEDATSAIALSGNNKIPLMTQLSPAVAAAM